jgi:uncharacterized membrane protein YjjP (DUF1212 family)
MLFATNFTERLMSGDLQAFVLLFLILLIVFIVYKKLSQVLYPYQGFMKIIGVFVVCLGLYTWSVYPERMGQLLNGVAGWITSHIEPLFSPDDTLELEGF